MAKIIKKLDIKDISGNKKSGTSLLRPWQDKYIQPLAEKVPSWLETNHLTLMTLAWSVLVLVGGYLSRLNRLFIIMCVLAMLGQYLTDFLDGEIGRRRKTGLILWGFLVDHYMDFVFGCVNVIAIGLILGVNQYLIMVGIIVSAGSFLLGMHQCNLFGKYDVNGHGGIGGIEIKIISALFYTLTIFIDKQIMLVALYLILASSTIQLIKDFYNLQKQVWEIDMENKKAGKI